MTRLEKKLRAILRRMQVNADSRVLVAVSGGADSTALLDALARLRPCARTPKKIFAAHLNHCLRGEESDADENFVQQFAARLEIPLHIERAEVATIAAAESRNLEATARQLRYEFLLRAAQHFNADVIVTAHTRDDQVETLLMRLLRGTGVEGLRGIHPIRDAAPGIQLIRPLLAITRAEVIAHCEQYKLAFQTDSSNFLPDFTRNRVRHELLPLLHSFNPRFSEALLRFNEQLAEDNDFLTEQMSAAFAASCDETASLEIKSLTKLHPAVRKRVLRHWIKTRRGNLRRIDATHVQAMDSLVMNSENERFVELPDGWQVWRKRGQLILLCVTEDNSPTE